MRHRLNFAYLEHSKIGLPALEAKQRIIVAAEISRRIGPTDRLAKHLTECRAIDSSCAYAKADD